MHGKIHHYSEVYWLHLTASSSFLNAALVKKKKAGHNCFSNKKGSSVTKKQIKSLKQNNLISSCCCSGNSWIHTEPYRRLCCVRLLTFRTRMTSPLNPLCINLRTVWCDYVHAFSIENVSPSKGLATWWYTVNKSCSSCIYTASQGRSRVSGVQTH